MDIRCKSLGDAATARLWDELAQDFGASYRSEQVLALTGKVEDVFALVISVDGQVVAGGLCRVRFIAFGPVRIPYLSFGVPYTTSAPLLFATGTLPAPDLDLALRQAMAATRTMVAVLRPCEQHGGPLKALSERYPSLTAASTWYLDLQGSTAVEPYIAKQGARRRKRLRRAWRSLGRAGGTFIVDRLNGANGRSLVELYRTWQKERCQSDGYDVEAYVRALQSDPQADLWVARLVVDGTWVAADLIAKTEIAVAAFSPASPRNLAVYEALYLNEVEWLATRGTSATLCIGAGSPLPKRRLGARESKSRVTFVPRFSILSNLVRLAQHLLGVFHARTP